ncbi:MAG: potassium channel family protein [Patescibacteria group bacterium]|nr:potassium channel family protein [Patescibacteria group bacterium]
MTQTSKQHHMRRVIALGVGVVTIGVLGFMIIEGWSFEDALYMVIITLTTIGYQEAQVLSDTGRWFNMVFILSGLGIVLYAISYI